MTSRQWRDLARFYLVTRAVPIGAWPRGSLTDDQLEADAALFTRMAAWRDKQAGSLDNWSA